MYRMYVNDIYGYLFRLTRDVKQAEDLTQETFFRAFSSLGDFRGEKVRPWLFKVAYHAFVDWYRKRVKTPIQLMEHLPEQADPLATDPERTYLAKEIREAAQALLERLPERQRQVIILFSMQLTYAEIAEVVGIDQADVKRSLFRGRQKMRRMWRDEGNDEQGR